MPIEHIGMGDHLSDGSRVLRVRHRGAYVTLSTTEGNVCAYMGKRLRVEGALQMPYPEKGTS